MFFVFHLCGST